MDMHYTIEPVEAPQIYSQFPLNGWQIVQVHSHGRIPCSFHKTLIEARTALREKLDSDRQLLKVISADNGMFHRSITVWG